MRPVIALVLVACGSSPSFDRCAVACGPAGACPAGTDCNPADGFCHEPNDLQTCTARDAARGADGALDAPSPPDAPTDGGLTSPDGDVPTCVGAEGGDCQVDATPGVCHGGSCCTGCWDGATCRLGFEDLACGMGGRPCEVCRSVCSCDPLSCPSEFNRLDHYVCGVGGTCVNTMHSCCGPADLSCDAMSCEETIGCALP